MFFVCFFDKTKTNKINKKMEKSACTQKQGRQQTKKSWRKQKRKQQTQHKQNMNNQKHEPNKNTKIAKLTLKKKLNKKRNNKN